ncbi:MAG: endonuclease domain-containing protein, partial [Chloroflexi bacterium]|nr:endonuclease domain-containing protein [Chloroflexota bacterium]
MTPAQRIHWRIVARHKENIEADIDELIQSLVSLTPNPSPIGRGEPALTPNPSPIGRGEPALTPGPSPEGRGGLPSPFGGRAGDEGQPRRYNPPLPEALKARVRELRKNATEAEALLWKILRNRAFHGAKFRRQHPVGGYILDFYCHEARLAIELDGSQHSEGEQIKYDEERTKILREQHGIDVIRFWNSEVLHQTEDVLNTLWTVLDERLAPSPLAPLPKGEGDSLPLSGEGLGMRADPLLPSGEGLGMRADP